MKDIDFDELDKAVNSLMGGVSARTQRNELKTLSINTTLKDGEQPAYDKIQRAAEKIGNEAIVGPTENTAVLSSSSMLEETVVSIPETAPKSESVDPLSEVANQLSEIAEKSGGVDATVASSTVAGSETQVPALATSKKAVETIDEQKTTQIEKHKKSNEVEGAGASEQKAETLSLGSVEQPEAQIAQAVQVAQKVSELAPKPPTGRFMDVMHPSSDMKTSTVTTSLESATATVAAPPPKKVPAIIVPQRPPRRVVTPLASSQPVPSQTAPLQSTVASPVVVPTQPIVPTNGSTPVTLSPQPQTVIAPVSAPSQASTSHDTGQPSFSRPTNLNSEASSPDEHLAAVEPLSSPFLSDAKIEKRPLGVPADYQGSERDFEEYGYVSKHKEGISADAQLAPQMQGPEAVMPDEFHTDLLAIETSTPDALQASVAVEQSVPSPDTAQGSADTTEDKMTLEAAPESGVTDAINPKVLDDASEIKGSESTEGTESPENGAIFDTTHYHTPVSHPAAQGAEWKWIAISLAIILICGAGAAAFYFLGSR